MTLIELQKILGDTINSLATSENDTDEMQTAKERAEFIAKIAKQMINNADVILRTDKLCNGNERINKIVGE